MCPACMASAGLIVSSVVSAGGVTAFITKVVKKKIDTNNSPNKEQSHDNRSA